jgi:hypothetical protein
MGFSGRSSPDLPGVGIEPAIPPLRQAEQSEEPIAMIDDSSTMVVQPALKMPPF